MRSCLMRTVRILFGFLFGRKLLILLSIGTLFYFCLKCNCERSWWNVWVFSMYEYVAEMRIWIDDKDKVVLKKR